MEITVKDKDLRKAAAEGADRFVEFVKDKIVEAAGGELTAEALQRLSADQTTLWAWFILRDEVMDGGFVQLIHNGYGDFFFRNPFAKALKLWDVEHIPQLIRKGQKLYRNSKDALMRECSDEEFMALFEQYPEFDELDDNFIEYEEEATHAIARYVDAHLDLFVKVAE